LKKRQIQGKDVPDDPNEWIRSKSFQNWWKWLLLFAGATVSYIGQIKKFGIMGMLAFPANPIAGFIGGVTVGYLYNVISVFQSLGAGIAADITWTNIQNTQASNIWKQNICYQWTWAMQGDQDGLIMFYQIWSWLWDFGNNPILRPEGGKFLYWNTYFDFGPWAGPGDSLILFGSWYAVNFVLTLFALSIAGGVKGIILWLTSLLIASTYALYYLFFMGVIMPLLKKWNLLPNIQIPDPYKGDYHPW